MNISSSDIIGSVGVFILLLAFVLNLLDRLSGKNIIYILMNIIGGGLACFASYLIHYIPFVILEGVWTVVSLFALLSYFKGK
ncbi:MAG: CBU_0592 family membrane protein [Chitinophagaceae bacterium]|jgi:hypothetical protein